MNNQFQITEERQKQPHIMIVDDEKLVTDALSGYLKLETEYNIHTFQSPVEAIKMLKERPVDLVISDYLMPEMNGLDFLSEVNKIYPDVPKIILTAYADKDNAIKAINEIGLYQYVEKPWDNKQLELIIRNGLAHKSLHEVLSEKIRELDQVLLQRDSLVKSQEALQQELALARRLQESILPQKLPEVNGISFSAQYLPAIEIGGDFYDVIPLANQHIAVLIVDITGHGIQAALSTTLLKFSFSDFIKCNVGPGDILSGMNEVLYKILPSNIFVAALVVIIDLRNAHCSLVNAGIPWPYLLRRKVKKVERIFANGFVLGFLEKELYEPGEEVGIELKKGDCLILSTDGLNEIENNTNEPLDTGMLKKIILQNSDKSGKAFMEKLIDDARKFSKKDHEWDDITILGIEAHLK